MFQILKSNLGVNVKEQVNSRGQFLDLAPIWDFADDAFVP